MVAGSSGRSELSAFFISPEGPIFDAVCGQIQKAVGDSVRVVPWTDLAKGGDVIRNIAASMYDSDLVFADLTGSSANVYYEVGLAHCFGRPLIAVLEKGAELPDFDLRGNHYVVYGRRNDAVQDESEFRGDVRRQVEAVIEGMTRGRHQPTPVSDLIVDVAAAYAVEPAPADYIGDDQDVVHPKYGLGTLELSDENEREARYLAHFDGVTRVLKVDSTGRMNMRLYLPPRQRARRRP